MSKSHLTELIVIFLVALGIAYFVVIKPVDSPADSDTSGWKTYRNEEYGFEFKYPSAWSIKKTDRLSVLESFLFTNNVDDDSHREFALSIADEVSMNRRYPECSEAPCEGFYKLDCL